MVISSPGSTTISYPFTAHTQVNLSIAWPYGTTDETLLFKFKKGRPHQKCGRRSAVS